MCSTGGKGSCRAIGITYEILCVPCRGMPSPGRYKYIGETARNAYTRGREHLTMLKNRNKTSVLWEHCKDVHGGNIVEFKMSVIKRYKNDAMMPQIMEAVIIESSKQGEIFSFPRVGLSWAAKEIVFC